MAELLSYLLKFSIGLSVVTLFYLLLLRRLTFYNWNRWYLLVYPLACFVLPLMDIGWWMDSHKLDYTIWQQLPALGGWHPGGAEAPASSADGWWWLGWSALAGMVFMTIRLLIQLLSFRRIYKRAVYLGGEEVKLFAVQEPIIPFSFGKSVFVNPSQHTETDLQEIIRHEMVHVRQHHTADMLVAELLLVVNWFNPFAWILRHAIRQNLEFIADRQVLDHGIDRKQYQYLLVKVVGQRNFSMGTHLNFSALKTRIIMMNKIRSARIHLLKFAFALPLAAVLLLAFRKKAGAIAGELPSMTAAFLTEPVMDTVTVSGTAEAGRAEYAQKTSKAHSDTLPGSVTITAAGSGSVRMSGLPSEDGVLYFVNGEEWPKQNVELIDAAKIQSITVLKGQQAIGRFGKKAKDGAIIITTKSAASTTITVRPSDGITTNAQIIFIVNGVETTGEELRKIAPDAIESVNVLKGDKAVEKYGERARNGVAEVKLKN
jgi:hypothetical protein